MIKGERGQRRRAGMKKKEGRCGGDDAGREGAREKGTSRKKIE
jgi:hypothetical protein